MRISVDDDKFPPGIAPGALIRLKARLAPPPPMALPGTYDFARDAWFKGIGAVGKAMGPVTVRALGRAARPRSGARPASGAHRSQLPAHPAGIAIALATGDQNAVDQDDADAMRRSGLTHLLSVSGLHIAAVVAFAMFLTLKLLALSERLALRFNLVLVAAAAAAAAGIGYTLLTGAQVPTVRSCVAAVLILAGIALGRDAISIRLIAAGALVVLLFRPEALAGASFQMSFAAVTAIVALHSTAGRAVFSSGVKRASWPGSAASIVRNDRNRPRGRGRADPPRALPFPPLGPVRRRREHHRDSADDLRHHAARSRRFAVRRSRMGPAFVVPVRRRDRRTPAVSRTRRFRARSSHAAAVDAALGVRADDRGRDLAMPVEQARSMARARALPGRSGRRGVRPVPDLLVTGDGKHLAVVGADGTPSVLRDRAGDYVRSLVAEASGFDGDPEALAARPFSACSKDACVALLRKGSAEWRLLATRSPTQIDWVPFTRACAEADIAVSDRRLPRGCSPRWLKLDRSALARTGGVAIYLGDHPRVDTVSDRVGEHPWSQSRPRFRSRRRVRCPTDR